MGLTGVGALTKAGAERQAYQQSLLDQPLKTATAASGLMRGYTVPGGQTSTFTGPKAGAYQTSGLQDILGTMSAVGSVAGGTGLKTLTGLGGSLADYLKGKIGGGNTDFSKFVGADDEGVGLFYNNGRYYNSAGDEVPVIVSEGD